MTLEKKTLSIEALDNEIAFSEELIEQFVTKQNALLVAHKKFTKRLAVLQAVELKVPECISKSITQENIKMVLNGRFALASELAKQKGNIGHYTKILEALRELKIELNKQLTSRRTSFFKPQI
ncbi:MAG: hypothetical protein ABWX58_06595 [Psychrobacillus psychrotolerans]